MEHFKNVCRFRTEKKKPLEPLDSCLVMCQRKNYLSSPCSCPYGDTICCGRHVYVQYTNCKLIVPVSWLVLLSWNMGLNVSEICPTHTSPCLLKLGCLPARYLLHYQGIILQGTEYFRYALHTDCKVVH
jgi:hypothetical protein